MGLTTSLYTSLSGLSASSQAINVTGNNIANVNTTGFKSSRALFQTQIFQTLRSGSAPTGELGTNAAEIGLGVDLASITRNFNTGTIQPTGVSTDMAIDGTGFFIVNQNGVERYTRSGNFTLDSDYNLVHPDGGLVQGYGVNSNFEVVQGNLQGINIPLGSLTVAEATSEVKLAGNLNAGGDIATAGTTIASDAIFSDAAGAVPAVATDDLTTLFNSAGDPLFVTGDVISLSGATKGGAIMPDKSFEVGAVNTTGSDAFGTTLQDLLSFLEQAMGVDTTIAGGASVVNGQVTLTGNSGTANALTLDNGDLLVNASTNPTLPFDFTQTQAATGESVRTGFVVYDSLGTPLNVELTMVLEQKSNAFTSWRFYAQSEGDTDLSRILGSGTVTFDITGKLGSATNATISIDRANTGAQSPLTIDLLFSDKLGSVSALVDTASQITATGQDGSPIGTLSGFSVNLDGTIAGTFSNGLQRTLGQITVAVFNNEHGLAEVGSNLFAATNSSGIAAVGAPGTGRAGAIVGSAQELSNVDLSQEFINLITASTGFSASSRVMSTSDRLIQELLTIIR